MSSVEAFVVLSTVPDAVTAELLAHKLVDARLAACVNIVPAVRSVYRWQGEVTVDDEVLLVAKTDGARRDGLIAALSDAHPYECPEIVALSVAAGLPAYLHWITDTLED
jgi:periplasmic divalent cation tolerance protein